MTRNRPGAGALLWALSALWAVAPARPLGAGPLIELLKSRQAKIDSILSRHPGELPPAAREQVGEAIAGLFDFAEMGQAALGAEWGKHGAAERKEFVDAFRELVRANALRRVDIYRSDEIEYLDEKAEGDKGSTTTLVRSKSAVTEVAYSLRRVGGAWHIVDYSIDGVSAVRNYRTQFARLLARRGWAALVERLKKRKDEIAGDPDESAGSGARPGDAKAR